MTLIKFDLNYWDSHKIRRFKNMDLMISTGPRE